MTKPPRKRRKKIEVRPPASPPRYAPPSGRRLWVYRILGLCFPLLLLGLAEIAFRIVPGLNEDRDPYVNISPVAVFSRTTENGQDYYNITNRFVLGAKDVHIPVKKPENTIRIFCLGGSACAGWPHPRDQTFSAYLEQALRTAYPGKRVEVVNAAAHGFAAYRTRRVLDEVLKMDPDAVIVWSGNNEFLEDRNYETPSTTLLALGQRLRTVQWLRTTFARRTDLSGGELKDVAQFFWKKTRQQSLRLRQDPEQFAQVQKHYQLSIAHMVKAARSRRVPIILCTVPVNLRDWLPAVSFHHLSGEQLEAWQATYYRARRCLMEGNFPEGVQAMDKAIAMEPDHAESYFWRGRLLEAEGEKEAAWEAYSKARDLDYNPFRALSSFNDSTRSVARANAGKGAHLLDLDRIFREASRYPAPGFDLFLDYVHPTRPGNLLVAEHAYDLLAGGIFPDKPAVEHFTYQDRASEGGAPYRDETDGKVQKTILMMATESRQYQRIVDKTQEILLLSTGVHLNGPQDPVLSRLPEEDAERYRVAWTYLDLQRKLIQGVPVTEEQQRQVTARVDAFYERWYPLGRF